MAQTLVLRWLNIVEELTEYDEDHMIAKEKNYFSPCRSELRRGGLKNRYIRNTVGAHPTGETRLNTVGIRLVARGRVLFLCLTFIKNSVIIIIEKRKGL